MQWRAHPRFRVILVWTALVAVVAVRADADPVLHLRSVCDPPECLDPPTVVTLGVRLPVSGDDDGDARVDMRYRAAGEATWHDALPLFRVHKNTFTDAQGQFLDEVGEQFGGSIFDLAPDTTYEI